MSDSAETARLVSTLDELVRVPINSVLVDRIGVAWQVVQFGVDWSHTKGHSDTRRPGFVQAGNHVTYEVSQLATVLPMRLIDNGRAEGMPAVAAPLVAEKLILFAGEIPNGVAS